MHWLSTGRGPAFSPVELTAATHAVRTTAHLVEDDHGRRGVATGGELVSAGAPGALPVLASLPALYPEWLGERSFAEVHRTRFPYASGAMANGIATTRLVIAMARSGCLGFFGAAGLSVTEVDAALAELQRELNADGLPWGSNLIHSPNEPSMEDAVADLYIRRGVQRVEASAFMSITPAVVRYACTGLSTDRTGRIVRRHRLFAKISREEVARHFLEPAPQRVLRALVEHGKLSEDEAKLAAQVPLAEDITVEADSGGHTDNRPLTALFPTIVALRDRIAADRGYPMPIRIGIAGGLGTPSAIAAAFALGAAYVVTGSINQSCVESGLHPSAKALLATAGVADVTMAPSADMFELGVEVQVLLAGSLFAVRSKKLYELFKKYPSLQAIPIEERKKVESQILRASFDEAWKLTHAFWLQRDPREVEKAEADPKHLMALVFRSYLGLASRWAITGEVERQADYQIWCGPAMGAFNAMARGSFLESPENRSVGQVAKNLLEGAAVVTRAQQLRSFGVAVPPACFDFRPRPMG